MGGFVVSQRVRVKTENLGPNRRVPDYVRGRLGVVFRVHGAVPDYSHDHSEDWGPLYSVLFGSTQALDSHSNEKFTVTIQNSCLVNSTTCLGTGSAPLPPGPLQPALMLVTSDSPAVI